MQVLFCYNKGPNSIPVLSLILLQLRTQQYSIVRFILLQLRTQQYSIVSFILLHLRTQQYSSVKSNSVTTRDTAVFFFQCYSVTTKDTVVLTENVEVSVLERNPTHRENLHVVQLVCCAVLVVVVSRLYSHRRAGEQAERLRDFKMELSLPFLFISKNYIC